MDSVNEPDSHPVTGNSPAGAPPTNSLNTLLEAFLDLSFATPITPHIVKWLYLISIITAGLIALSSVISGFANGIMAGLVALFIAPVLFVIYVLAARVALEVMLAIFRIAEAVTAINQDRDPNP